MKTLRLGLLLLVFISGTISCSLLLGSYDGPVVLSHGFVQGVSPSNSSAFLDRSYPTIEARWDGPGGDKLWLAVNLGARVEPESSVDTNPDAAGWKFQFNRKQAFHHDGSRLVPQWRNQPINEDRAWEPANDPCRILLGDSWRIPTVEEMRAFREAPKSQGGMGEGNRTDAFNSSLKLHAAGDLHPFYGRLRERGDAGRYWASDQFQSRYGEAFGFDSDGSSTFGSNKNSGRPVRCIRD